MDGKFTPALIIAIAVVALSALMFMFWLDGGSDDSGMLPAGNYVIIERAAASESLDNLAQMDDCINRSDQACETSMISDGRAFLVGKGTLLGGSEIGYGVFEGRVHSGAHAGEMVYLPVSAVKASR